MKLIPRKQIDLIKFRCIPIILIVTNDVTQLEFDCYPFLYLFFNVLLLTFYITNGLRESYSMLNLFPNRWF